MEGVLTGGMGAGLVKGIIGKRNSHRPETFILPYREGTRPILGQLIQLVFLLKEPPQTEVISSEIFFSLSIRGRWNSSFLSKLILSGTPFLSLYLTLTSSDDLRLSSLNRSLNL